MTSSAHSMSSLPASDPVAAAVRGFACPFEPLDRELQQAIVSEYARGYLGLFAGRHREALGPVAEALEKASETDIPFDTAWDISFGRVRRALQTAAAESPQAVAAAVMRRLDERPDRSVRLLAPDEAMLVEPFDESPPGCPWRVSLPHARRSRDHTHEEARKHARRQRTGTNRSPRGVPAHHCRSRVGAAARRGGHDHRRSL